MSEYIYIFIFIFICQNHGRQVRYDSIFVMVGTTRSKAFFPEVDEVNFCGDPGTIFDGFRNMVSLKPSIDCCWYILGVYVCWSNFGQMIEWDLAWTGQGASSGNPSCQASQVVLSRVIQYPTCCSGQGAVQVAVQGAAGSVGKVLCRVLSRFGGIFCKSMPLRACNGRKDTSLKPLLFEVYARAISIWFPSFELAQLWNRPGSKFLEEARHLCETWRNQVRSSNEYIYIFIYLYLLISWWFCDMFTVWRQDLLSLM